MMSKQFPVVRDCLRCGHPFRPTVRGSWLINADLCSECVADVRDEGRRMWNKVMDRLRMLPDGD